MEENRNAPLGEFWKDGAEGNTPLSAENLNARELKIAEEFKNNNLIIFGWYFENGGYPFPELYVIPKGTKWNEMATICPEFWRNKGCYITTEGYVGWSLTTYICEYGLPNIRIASTDEVKQGMIYTSSGQQS